MDSPRIAVVGTGAVGASVAGDLTRAGLDVTLIDQWPANVERLKKDGLTVHLPDAPSQHTPVTAHHLCEVAELRVPFDAVFIAVKSYDTRWAAELITPLLHPTSIVIALQNGVTIDDVAEVVGADRTVGAVIGIAANMYEPGVVVRQVPKERTWFTVGAVDPDSPPDLDLAQRLLAHAGTTETTDDIRSSKWMKLIANVPEMLPSGIVGLPLVAAAALPGMRELMDAAGREAYRVAIAAGIRMLPIFGKTAAEVPPDERYASELLDSVLTVYALPDTKVAVLQDWEKGRRAELDAFSGYIVKTGLRIGVPTPVNDVLLETAQRIEGGELKPAPENVALLSERILPALV